MLLPHSRIRRAASQPPAPCSPRHLRTKPLPLSRERLHAFQRLHARPPSRRPRDAAHEPPREFPRATVVPRSFLEFAATVARASSSVSCAGAAKRAEAKAWIAGVICARNSVPSTRFSPLAVTRDALGYRRHDPCRVALEELELATYTRNRPEARGTRGSRRQWLFFLPDLAAGASPEPRRAAARTRRARSGRRERTSVVQAPIASRAKRTRSRRPTASSARAFSIARRKGSFSPAMMAHTSSTRAASSREFCGVEGLVEDRVDQVLAQTSRLPHHVLEGLGASASPLALRTNSSGSVPFGQRGDVGVELRLARTGSSAAVTALRPAASPSKRSVRLVA